MGMKAISMTMEQISWILADAGVFICGICVVADKSWINLRRAKSNFCKMPCLL